MSSVSSSMADGALTQADLVGRVETYLDEFLTSRALPDNLREAMRYAVLGPGKRMRPILVFRGCEAAGGAVDDALAPAAAIEMIHAFSLVHDDLPAMDDDDLRRGRATLHRHTSEPMAILAGDALMGLAFELIATQVDDAALSRALTRELTHGTNEMIAGQVYDTLPDFSADTEALQQLEAIHRHKTGALIRAAVRMGALCAPADAEQLDRLGQYAEAIGLMFQVVDDVLDATQSTEQLGKTAGKDATQEKLTYPALIGLDASRREVQRLHDQALAALTPFGPAGEHLRELARYLAVRTK